MCIYRAISALVKSFAIVAVALAVVFSPPSAAHAASGMHANQHSAAAHAVVQSEIHTHDMSQAVAAGVAVGSKAAASDDASGNCCSGVCFSVVLNNTHPDSKQTASTGRYIVLDAQTASVEPSGVLRPPQFLI
jgi:hypothetical protein